MEAQIGMPEHSEEGVHSWKRNITVWCQSLSGRVVVLVGKNSGSNNGKVVISEDTDLGNKYSEDDGSQRKEVIYCQRKELQIWKRRKVRTLWRRFGIGDIDVIVILNIYRYRNKCRYVCVCMLICTYSYHCVY